MRGSAIFRTGVAPGGALAGPWVRDPLWTRARAVPSLDLRFADNKSLVDATTGASLVTFTRASSGTYVGSDGVIKSATTNEARFDHNPTTGESLGLLVEEARTNLFLQSNQFDTTWTNTSSSETAASGTAPDGTNTAWELKDTLDVILTSHQVNQTITFTSGVTYTFTCWMKAGTLTQGGFVLPAAAFTTAINCRINLLTGSVITSSATLSTSTTLFPNGWVRVTATAVATATIAGSASIRIMDGATSYIGTGNGTILIWGAQLEAGAFPTSYIPTTTATVTRAADVASITGSNFSSWYNQTEGTVFANVTLTRPPSTVGVNILGIGDGTNSNRVQLNSGSSSAGNINGVVTTGGVAQAQPLVGSISSVGPHKIGFGYATNSVQIGVNGSLGTEDTSATMPSTITAAYLANGANPIAPASMTFARLTFWPPRLSNEVIQRITQP